MNSEIRHPDETRNRWMLVAAALTIGALVLAGLSIYANESKFTATGTGTVTESQ